MNRVATARPGNAVMCRANSTVLMWLGIWFVINKALTSVGMPAWQSTLIALCVGAACAAFVDTEDRKRGIIPVSGSPCTRVKLITGAVFVILLLVLLGGLVALTCGAAYCAKSIWANCNMLALSIDACACAASAVIYFSHAFSAYAKQTILWMRNWDCAM